MASGSFHFVVYRFDAGQKYRDAETIDGQTVSEVRARFEISQRRQMDAPIGESAPTRCAGTGRRAGRSFGNESRGRMERIANIRRVEGKTGNVWPSSSSVFAGNGGSVKRLGGADGIAKIKINEWTRREKETEQSGRGRKIYKSAEAD